jgi:hypothetical protein
MACVLTAKPSISKLQTKPLHGVQGFCRPKTVTDAIFRLRKSREPEGVPGLLV